MGKMQKRGQTGIEYMIIIGFVIFAVGVITSLSLIYSSSIRDKIKMDQLNDFSTKIISASESVFYSGEPSRATLSAYLPEGINAITINNKELIVNLSLSSGENIRVFPSRVSLSCPANISQFKGLKKIRVEARVNDVLITAL